MGEEGKEFDEEIKEEEEEEKKDIEAEISEVMGEEEVKEPESPQILPC